MSIIESILLAIGLCADCFAVSLCSSITIKSIRLGSVGRVALCFAIIQTALLLIGWAFGNLFVGLVYKVAHIIGFLLLLYVGGSMLVEGLRGDEEIRNLDGMLNVILGGIATSIDALAVGVSQSMAGTSRGGLLPLAVSVFVVTALSVFAGIYGGNAIGRRFGRWTECVGGVVLIGIGISIVLS